jgi:hypothetical protein
MACPHVSGVAALILSVYGGESFTPDMLRARLLYSATPLAGFDPANASRMGAGLLNAAAALAPGATPEAVTDLTAQAASHVSGNLSWTVPPVSDNGTVATFEVACSTGEITTDNFDKNIVASTRTSISSGNEQTYNITGLEPSTTYHVAIRSVGSIGSKSVISNIATLTTMDNHAPVISGLPADTTLIPHQAISVVLSRYFTDVDGDYLNYHYTLTPTGIANINVRGSTLTIDPKAHGDAVLQITASDPFAATIVASVNITVEQKYAPDKAGELLLYPNPTSDVLWYSYLLKEPALIIVRIVNASGQTMFQTPAKRHQAGAYYYSIPLTDWSAGVYFVQYIEDGKTINTKKIVKQ